MTSLRACVSKSTGSIGVTCGAGPTRPVGSLAEKGPAGAAKTKKDPRRETIILYNMFPFVCRSDRVSCRRPRGTTGKPSKTAFVCARPWARDQLVINCGLHRQIRLLSFRSTPLGRNANYVRHFSAQAYYRQVFVVRFKFDVGHIYRVVRARAIADEYTADPQIGNVCLVSHACLIDVLNLYRNVSRQSNYYYLTFENYYRYVRVSCCVPTEWAQSYSRTSDEKTSL